MFSKRIKWKSFIYLQGKIHLYTSFMLKFPFIRVAECKLRKLWDGYTLRMYCSSPPNLSRFSFSIKNPWGFSPPMLFIHRATAPAIKPPLHLLQEIQFLASGCEKQYALPKIVRLAIKGRFLWGAYVEPTWRLKGWSDVKCTSASQWKLQQKKSPPKSIKGPPRKLLQASRS